MIEIYDCSVFNVFSNVIAHQVNCQGVMGSGVAKQIRDRYPEVYTQYKAVCEATTDKSKLLGKALIVEVPVNQMKTVRIANLFAQFDYNRSYRQNTDVFTSVPDFRLSVINLKDYANKWMLENWCHNFYIAMPYNIGCGRGGANWLEIEEILIDEFARSDRITLKLCRYKGD